MDKKVIDKIANEIKEKINNESDIPKEFIYKFAEAIIRESANVVKNVYKQGGGTYAEKILNHFNLK